MRISTVACIVGLMAVLLMSSSAARTGVSFKRITIDKNPPERPWTKLTADFDGDGRADVAIGGRKGPLLWYPSTDWKPVHVAKGGWNTVAGAVGDVDGDGDPDIVMGSQLWFENPLPGASPRTEPWKAHVISEVGSHDIALADFDRDGQLDLVMRDQSSFSDKKGNAVHFWRQAAPGDWQYHRIDAPHGEGLAVADVDLDGYPDVIIPGQWYANDGKVSGAWTPFRYTSRWTYPDGKIAVGDFNRDGRPDIAITPAELKGSYYRVAWYASTPSPRMNQEWPEVVITEEVETVVHAAAVADFNADGWPDLATADMHQGESPQQVRLHLNPGSSGAWPVTVLSETGSHDI